MKSFELKECIEQIQLVEKLENTSSNGASETKCLSHFLFVLSQ